MFKTEEDEKEQLDLWMDLINENEEHYEPRAPHSFLKRGQGKIVKPKSKSPNKDGSLQPELAKSPTKRNKRSPLTYEDKFDMFVDRMEGGTGGPYQNNPMPEGKKGEGKKQSVYMNRPPRRSVVNHLMSQATDQNASQMDSPEMLKYKADKTKKEKTLLQIH